MLYWILLTILDPLTHSFQRHQMKFHEHNVINLERFRMETALKKELSQQTSIWTPEELQTLKDTVCKGLTDPEFKVFLYAVKRTGLDPFMRQIYAVKRRNKNGSWSMTIQTGIDGYRLTADRTGLYAGSDDPILDDDDHPSKAIVTVYKMVQGVRCAFTASARWNEYYPSQNAFMWDKMPCLMIGKVAEALALRKAFPAELSGIYTAEEMDQAVDEDKNEPAIEKLVTEKQINRLWYLMKQAGASVLDVNSLVRAHGKDDPKQLSMSEYELVCEAIVNGDWKNEDNDIDLNMSELDQVAPQYTWKSKNQNEIVGQRKPWDETLERIKNKGTQR